jgi:hypothetical protein
MNSTEYRVASTEINPLRSKQRLGLWPRQQRSGGMRKPGTIVPGKRKEKHKSCRDGMMQPFP